MKFDENLFYGFLIGAFLVFLFFKIFSKKVSDFTVQDFPETMKSNEADALFKSQTTGIASELSQKLSAAVASNMSKEDMIKLAWEYADSSNQLNKNYSAYKIRTMPVSTPGKPQS